MENYGLKGLLVTLYQRVILSYKTTLIAMLLVAADAIVSHFLAQPLPPWAHTLVGIVASVLTLVKERQPKSALDVGPTAMLLIAASLTFTACSHVKAVAERTLDCASPQLMSAAHDATGVVLDKLKGSTQDFSDQLDGLALNLGADVVICAVKETLAELSKPRQDPSITHNMATLTSTRMDDLAYARGRMWLQKNGVVDGAH